MNTIEKTNVTTFSMILSHVIHQHIQSLGMTLNQFYALTGISQPSWSRLSRGQTRFDIEDLKTIEKKVGIPMLAVIETASAVEKKALKEGIQIIEPYTTQKKSDLAELGLMVVAGAVLGFLAVQAIKSKS